MLTRAANHYDFAGRVALVTGGANGIGAAVAERLRRGGAKVAVFDLRLPSADGLLGMEGDVRDSDAIARAVRRVEAELGSLDVLVCSAGVFGPSGPSAAITDGQWRDVLAINADGTFFANRAALPGMIERGYGRILNIASVAGKEGNPRAAAYAASKAAVIALTKSLAMEAVGSGVRVHCVAPAIIETPMVAGMPAGALDAMVAKIPMGRVGSPAEVATLVAFLASEEFDFSTGACFDLSGGRATY